MRLEKCSKLRGPNLWATVPVFECWLDLENASSWNSREDSRFRSRLLDSLPELSKRSSPFGQLPFPSALEMGLGMAEIFGHVVLELQAPFCPSLALLKTRPTSQPSIHRIAIEYDDETVAEACVNLAMRFLRDIEAGHAFDLKIEWNQIRDLAHDVALGPSTRSIVEAAKKRSIPWRRLNSGSLVQFGYGASQRRICTAEADSTSAIAEAIAQDKQLTRSLLRAVGVPVPEGRPVTDANDAWAAAKELGVPVVVKPQFGNHGRGVATNLASESQVKAAFEAAREEGDSVLVEQFSPGDDYRLLVVGNRMVAAAKREPANVMGDGIHTIDELIAIVNQDPRRSDGHATSLSMIRVDAVAKAVLQEQGFTTESIPRAGTRVLIRRNANLSTGGTATDVTDLLHPEVARHAVEAAKVIGLDIAGIDVVALDISQPLASQRAAIVEVNAGPGLRMHLEPSNGEGRPVGEAIVDLVYPVGSTSRIPIVGVTGVNGKTTTTRLVAHILASSGKKVGMTCTDGIYVGNRRVDTGDCSGPKSARSILLNPTIEAAVFETARGGMIREGLGFDQCDVAIVTNIGEGDHLGISDVHTKEQLAEVKSILVRAVSQHGAAVLKADDPLVAAMADLCPGHVVFFALDPEHPLILAKRKAGGRAAFIRDRAIVLADGNTEIRLLTLDRIPITHAGRIGFQVENVLSATAACWSLGMPCEQIRKGLESFSAHMEKIPGRFNLLEINGATVIVDYGHNPSSLQSIIDAISLFPHSHRTAIYSAAGDRRDVDMILQGRLLGSAFDRVLIYEDAYLRGRPTGEITRLFQEGIESGTRSKETLTYTNWKLAVDEALRLVRSGDLLLVQADVIDDAVEYIQGCFVAHLGTRETDLDGAIKPPAAPNQPSTAAPETIKSVKGT